MRYRVLGAITAVADDTVVRLGGPKQRLVLALLLRDAGRPVTDDHLTEAVWPDDAPSGARHTLQTYVSELRRILDDDIVREGRGYRLDIDPEKVDAHRFDALTTAARDRMADAPAGAAALFREALALWRGEPYADVADTPALQDEIHRLRQARLGAVEDRVQADLDAGRHVQAALDLEGLAREHPYRERLHGLLILALYRDGRQAEALRAYERARSTLAADLGVDPSPELQRLQQQVLEQDLTILLPAESSSSDVPAVVRGFELRGEVARRGPATLWHAYQASASREVAVALVAPHEANALAFVRRFDPLARRYMHVEHPNLLALLDHWRDPRGAYLVTPWVPGTTVRRTLDRATWTMAGTLRMLEQAADALTTLHDDDLVHGGVASAAMLLDEQGDVLLGPLEMLVPGVSATYDLAPEVRQGGAASVSSDVYGLGAVAMDVLVGPPSPREDRITDLQRRGSALPPGVTEVLARALAADPAHRPHRVFDLVRDLRRVAGADVVALSGHDSPSSTLRNPYKGLRAFQETDAQDFHGREDLVDDLVDTVRARRLVAVVGPSGSGKSSLVRAGLTPAMRRHETLANWLVTEMFPGADPFEELEAALLRVAVDEPEGLLGDLLADDRGLLRAAKQVLPPDSELVLVVDQFEELFHLTTDGDIRQLFLDSLVALASDDRAPVRTLITVRADWFDRPLEHHGLGTLVREGLVPIGMPSPHELARAISQPARGVGVSFEPGLVDTIVRDVADQPGALPLLQHALTELFEHRDGRLLTVDAYQATGGVLGALGRRSDELYGSLPPAGQDAVEQVFMRLVSVDEQGEPVRRRARRAELTSLEADPAAVESVVRLFGAHRLLSFDRDPVTRGPTVEVTHEALFQRWGILRRWIASRREDLVLHRRLAAAVAEWEQSDRAPDYLLAGGRLDQFQRWGETTDLALTDTERSFLATSTTRQADLDTMRRRRRRGVLTSLAAVAMVAIAMAGVAVLQQQRARAGEAVALSRELSAASRLQQPVDPDVAIHLALEAVEVARDAGALPLRDAVSALHEAVLGHRLLATVDVGGTLVDADSDGDRVFVSGPPGNRASLWDLDEEQPVVLRDDGRQAFQAAVSPDGRHAVETFVGAPTLVWDLEAQHLSAELPPTKPFQLWPTLSPDGTTLAVADLEQFGVDEDQTISLWDLDTGTRRLTFPHQGNARHLAFSPDGQTLAVADMQNAVVRLYDTETGEVQQVIGDPTDARGVNSVAFDPSGSRLAMFVFTPRELRIVDIRTEEIVRSVPLGTASIGAQVCYSPEGDLLAVATGDGLLNLYDTTGLLRLELPGSGATESLACGPDGDQVLLATDHGTLRVWGLAADDAGEVLTIAAPAPFTGAWTHDGQTLVTTHYGGALLAGQAGPPTGSLRRYDATTGELEASVSDLHPFPPWWVSVSPDGRFVAANADPFDGADPAAAPVDVPRNARLRIHDAATLQTLHEIDGGGWPLGFSPDSSRLLVGGMGTARVVDAATGRVEADLPVPHGDQGAPPEVGGGAFLPDGDHAVVFGNSGAGWILELEPPHEATAMLCGLGGFRTAVSRDGRWVAAETADVGVGVWDVPDLLGSGSTDCGEDAVEPIRTFDGAPSLGLAFDPEGRRLAAAGFDGVLSVWDVTTGQQDLRVEHDGQAGGASFSPDGDHVLVTVHDAGGSRHGIHVYTLDPDELVRLARERVSRDLTETECQIFLPHRCPRADP